MGRAYLVASLVSCVLLLAGCQRGVPPPAGQDAPVVPPGPPFFEEVAKSAGIDFTYRNGEEAGHFAILESQGGGVALLDYDGDGLLDIYIPGGGYYDKCAAQEPNPVATPELAGLLWKRSATWAGVG